MLAPPFVEESRVNDTLRVGLAQLRPVLLHRDRTRARVIEWIEKAADDRCRLIAFGEALVPAYPFWLTLTDGARFESSLQKAIHARYLDQAVDIDGGDLDPVCAAARRCTAWVYLGVVERPRDRGAHSLYCTLVAIDDRGRIRSTHRKLVPTYEERLAWSPGDGHGLQIHELDAFRIGGLNCWENWMPLPRAALQAQGENVHLAVWPGNRRNTGRKPITARPPMPSSISAPAARSLLPPIAATVRLGARARRRSTMAPP